ncbi:FAD binding domain-containing protein [Dongia sp.]|uniref:FAD binding domain-containing protein n=1 Tax=Dongia sp. TaxID=1977262 RepID=UPI003753B6E2
MYTNNLQYARACLLFAQPTRLDEALDLAARNRPIVLAGGTDLMVGASADLGPGPVLDISRVAELKGIAITEDSVVIGGGTTWSELVAADLPHGFDGLKAAALEVGSIQIQNRGTIAGNLCNASPAADGVPPLLTLDAMLEIQASGTRRSMAVGDFITGNRKTLLQPGELVTAIRIPRQLAEGRSAFLKLGSRRFLVISIVSVAALLVADGYRITAARVAIGACSAVAKRLPELEAALLGRSFDASLRSIAKAEHVAGLAPIDDVRGTGGYRKDAALQLIREALLAVVEGRAGGMA